MALPHGSYELGPSTGFVHGRTGREGVASLAGHDLLIAFGVWSGRLVVAKRVVLEVEVDLRSLEVLEGTGGAAALSGRDVADITRTALGLLVADADPLARFSSDRVVAAKGGGTVEGTLTLNGRANPMTLQVEESGTGSWRGSATVLQSAYGIKPYRAFFGALRLADPVQVEVGVDLP